MNFPWFFQSPVVFYWEKWNRKDKHTCNERKRENKGQRESQCTRDEEKGAHCDCTLTVHFPNLCICPQSAVEETRICTSRVLQNNCPCHIKISSIEKRKTVCQIHMKLSNRWILMLHLNNWIDSIAGTRWKNDMRVELEIQSEHRTKLSQPRQGENGGVDRRERSIEEWAHLTRDCLNSCLIGIMHYHVVRATIY